MAFTYLGTLATDRDKVRFNLGDTASGNGPLPGDANFTDAEIDGLLAQEGSWPRAVAAGFERLAASWRKYPKFEADGLSLDRTAIAEGFQKQAKAWRDKYGDAGSSIKYAAAGSRPTTRVDGYSSDIDNQET